MGLMQPRSELKNHMILAKTMSSCCTSTRRATSSIAIYLVGYKICTTMHHLLDVHRAYALPTRYGKWCFFLFFFLIWHFFASFIFSLLILFSFAHPLLFMPTQDIWYKITSAQLLLGNYTVQMCKAQAIIKS